MGCQGKEWIALRIGTDEIKTLSQSRWLSSDRCNNQIHQVTLWFDVQGMAISRKAWILLMSKAWMNGSGKGWRKIRERILLRDGCCQQCGETEGQMHIDHIVPKRLGGTDHDENLQQLCQKCNLRKGGAFFEAALTPPTLHGRYIPQNVSKSHDQA